MSKNRERAEEQGADASREAHYAWNVEYSPTSSTHHVVHGTYGSVQALKTLIERERDEEWRLGLSAPQSGTVPGHMLDHIKAALDQARAEGYEEAWEQAARAVESDATVSLFDGSTKPERNYHKRRAETLARAFRAMKPGRRG